MPEEAIKNLRRQLAVRLGNISLATAIHSGDKRALSIQLGIEALERLVAIRQSDNRECFHCSRPLPSETYMNKADILLKECMRR